jgi:hypothetical protein
MNEMKQRGIWCLNRPFISPVCYPPPILKKIWIKLQRHFSDNREYSTENIDSTDFRCILKFSREYHSNEQKKNEIFVQFCSTSFRSNYDSVPVTNFIPYSKMILLHNPNSKTEKLKYSSFLNWTTRILFLPGLGSKPRIFCPFLLSLTQPAAQL